jgi:hypothetical protein
MRFQIIAVAGGALLLASHLTAQTNLPLSPLVRQQLVQRIPELVARLDQMCHACKGAGVADRGSEPRLDSTVVYTGYAIGPDSFPLEKTIFDYPAADVTVGTEYVNFNDWSPNTRATQKQDNLGRLVEMYGEFYDTDTDSWQPESKMRAYPHGNLMTGQDSLLVEIWDADAEIWVTTLRVVTTFDAQNRPISTYTFTNFAGPEIALLDTFYYDANGDNYLTEQSIFEDGNWAVFSRIESVFSQHREIRRTTSAVAAPGTYFPTNMEETTYNAAGNPVLIESSDFDFFTNKWVLTEKIERGYDSQNRLVYIQTEDYTTNGPAPNRFDYTYLDGLHLALETYSEKDPATQQWAVLDRTYYFYSGTTSSRDIVIGTPLQVSPNPTTGLVRLALESTPTQLSVLNLNGTRVSVQRSGQYENEVDLRSLPAGVYYIIVQEGHERRVGKVVKY